MITNDASLTPAERIILSCQYGIIRDMTEFVALLLFVGAVFIWLP
jgi:hypothetical protein